MKDNELVLELDRRFPWLKDATEGMPSFSAWNLRAMADLIEWYKELTQGPVARLHTDDVGHVIFATWKTSNGMTRVKMFAKGPAQGGESYTVVNIFDTEEQAIEWGSTQNK